MFENRITVWTVVLVCLVQLVTFTGFRYFLSVSSQNTILESTTQKPQSICSYPFQIFIYPLPPVYNYAVLPEFLRNTSYKGRIQTGPNLTSPWPFNNEKSIMQLTMEIAIHWALVQHPCRTHDPELATFFYIPAYTAYMHWFGAHLNLRQLHTVAAAAEPNFDLPDREECQTFPRNYG